MGKIDSWITKIPRLKNSKVARFSYRAEAYANDEIEGVENYDYAQDMNVPLATHTDFEPSMLSIGARTNFSVIPKNGLNHFFGRVSYNLNKVIDFLSDFLDDFRVQGIETIRSAANFTLGTYYDGKKIRIANTHATNTITCTLPSGQKMNGEGTISIPAGRIIDIELIGATWKDNLTGNADTATNAIYAMYAENAANATIAGKLKNARTINGVPFDGSADITVADSTKAPLASPAFTGTPTVNGETLPEIVQNITDFGKTTLAGVRPYYSDQAAFDEASLKAGFYAVKGSLVGGAEGNDGGAFTMIGQNDTRQFGWDSTNALRFRSTDTPSASTWSEWRTIWHSGNDSALKSRVLIGAPSSPQNGDMWIEV